MTSIFLILQSHKLIWHQTIVPSLTSLSLCGHLACLLSPDAQQKAGNMPEVKDYSF